MAHVVLGDITPSSKLTVVKHRNLSLLKKENDLSFHKWIPFRGTY
jgi:hypothetical protein